MINTILEDERLKKTYVVILVALAVVTLSTAPLIVGLQNSSAATLVRGSVSYAAHHYSRTCGLKAFTQGKCFPKI
jgi:hypothetical protein